MTTFRLRACAGALLATLLVAGCATSAPSAAGDGAPHSGDARRLIPLQGALNVRTLEDLRGTHGPIPAGSFVRSADLSRLTEADRDVLAGRDVVLALDLRTAEELASSPNRLATDQRFRYTRISLLGTEKLDVSNLPDDLGTMYVAALDANSVQFRQAFEAIAAERDGAVLFHCTAGKDRTGMIAAMLLSLAGVPRGDIVHDYVISAHYLEPMMSAQGAQMEEIVRLNPKIRALMGSPATAIVSFLDALEHTHGGARAYLRKIGVSESDIGHMLVRLGQTH